MTIMQSPGTLYIVATPIGNLDDLSPRAREILETSDLIAAEDTRHTGRLLSHFGIKTRQFALHDHNEERRVPELIARLKDGKTIALVSDAGTPLISDPGYRLLCAARSENIPVSPLPGPSAVVAALSVAGLPADRFCFEGFLPSRAAARRERLSELRAQARTMVFYESVHRIAACIDDMVNSFGSSRPAFLARELTKLHEQCVRADLAELQAQLAGGSVPRKGEFVLVVAGATGGQGEAEEIPLVALLTELSGVVSGKQAVAIACRLTGRRRNELYKLMLSLDAE
jgi:16S rRNA (cytidine1402-2'-O)-methyltransferase